MSKPDPLLQAIFDRLPREPVYPQAPRHPGGRLSFPDRAEWLVALLAALELVYGPPEPPDIDR